MTVKWMVTQTTSVKHKFWEKIAICHSSHGKASIFMCTYVSQVNWSSPAGMLHRQ